MKKKAGIGFGRNSRGRLIGVALAVFMGIWFVLPYAFGEGPSTTGIESKMDPFVETAAAQAKAEKQLLGMNNLVSDHRSGWSAAYGKIASAGQKIQNLLNTAISEENSKPAEQRDNEFIGKALKLQREAGTKQQELLAERTEMYGSYNDAKLRHSALKTCYDAVGVAFKQCKNVDMDPSVFIPVYLELQRLAKEPEKQAKEAVTGVKSIAERATKELGEVETFVQWNK